MRVEKSASRSRESREGVRVDQERVEIEREIERERKRERVRRVEKECE